MRSYVVPPPQLAPGLPTGNQPGGVFEASYNPDMYGNSNSRTIPANSPRSAEVVQRITTSRVGFQRLSANGMGGYRPTSIPGWRMPAEASVPGGGVFNQDLSSPTGTQRIPAIRR